MLQLRKIAFVEKWVLNFETRNSTFYAKFHFLIQYVNPLERRGQWDDSARNKMAE